VGTLQKLSHPLFGQKHVYRIYNIYDLKKGVKGKPNKKGDFFAGIRPISYLVKPFGSAPCFAEATQGGALRSG